MTVYIASDHRGFALKEKLREFLTGKGHTVYDLNPEKVPGDDYPIATYAVVEKLHANPEARGIVLCGSGAGVAIAANRFPSMRAAIGLNVTQISAARHDDDVNILGVAADFIQDDEAFAIADAFLTTAFEPSERYKRRIHELEHPPSFN